MARASLPITTCSASDCEYPSTTESEAFGNRAVKRSTKSGIMRQPMLGVMPTTTLPSYTDLLSFRASIAVSAACRMPRACSKKRRSASIPGEQFGFKLDLQGTDLATQGGLRDIEEVRRLPDTIEFRSLHEITELLDFHAMIPRCENRERTRLSHSMPLG